MNSFLFLLLLLSSCLFIPVCYSIGLFIGQRQISRRQYDVKSVLHLEFVYSSEQLRSVIIQRRPTQPDQKKKKKLDI